MTELEQLLVDLNSVAKKLENFLTSEMTQKIMGKLEEAGYIKINKENESTVSLVGDWILNSGQIRYGKEEKFQASEAFRNFQAWSGEKASGISQKAFGMVMKKFFHSEKGSVYYYYGIGPSSGFDNF